MSAANTTRWIGIGLLGLPLYDYRFLKYLAIGRRT